MRRLIIGSLVALIAACQGPTPSIIGSAGLPGSSSSPEATLGSSPSAPPSTVPSPSAAPSPTPAIGTLDVFPPGAAVQVSVAELNLRAKASTSEEKCSDPASPAVFRAR